MQENNEDRHGLRLWCQTALNNYYIRDAINIKYDI